MDQLDKFTIALNNAKCDITSYVKSLMPSIQRIEFQMPDIVSVNDKETIRIKAFGFDEEKNSFCILADFIHSDVYKYQARHIEINCNKWLTINVNTK